MNNASLAPSTTFIGPLIPAWLEKQWQFEKENQGYVSVNSLRILSLKSERPPQAPKSPVAPIGSMAGIRQERRFPTVDPCWALFQLRAQLRRIEPSLIVGTQAREDKKFDAKLRQEATDLYRRTLRKKAAKVVKTAKIGRNKVLPGRWMMTVAEPKEPTQMRIKAPVKTEVVAKMSLDQLREAIAGKQLGKPASLAKPRLFGTARKPEKTCKVPPRKTLDDISKAIKDALAIANQRKAPSIAPRSCLAWTFDFSLLACQG